MRRRSRSVTSQVNRHRLAVGSYAQHTCLVFFEIAVLGRRKAGPAGAAGAPSRGRAGGRAWCASGRVGRVAAACNPPSLSERGDFRVTVLRGASRLLRVCAERVELSQLLRASRLQGDQLDVVVARDDQNVRNALRRLDGQ